MSRTRQRQPVLADHKLFVFYRWLSWLIAGVAIVWQHAPPYHVLLLMIAALVNLVTTFVAQRYVRIAQQTPALMSLDIVYCVALLYASGGWSGPMSLYALSGLVLPALLRGWRGGIMSGLTLGSLGLAVHGVNGALPTTLWNTGHQVELFAMLMIPPLFGCFFPTLAEMLRRGVEQRDQAHRKPHSPFDDPQLGNTSDLDALDRFATRGRAQERRPLLPMELQPTRGTAVRAVEPNIEDLRRTLFAPFPQPDMDMPAILNLLATRFSTQTGCGARVIPLGRARPLAFAQRLVLVRLLQEALLNVQQHAHASNVDLTLRYDAHSIALLVQDNGVGLLDGTHARPGLHGLRAMQYRLSELGGRLDVFETEGGGVTVRATAPLE